MSIEAAGISKSFGTFRALTDVTVDIAAGKLTALLGPSGGGKSTLLRIIAGLEVPDTGQVRIDGAEVTRLPARKRRIGFVFQHYAAFAHMTVWDNVAFGLKVSRVPGVLTRHRVTELLQLVHLDGLAHRYPAELSGGQRQRMALARALAVAPRVLLLDEPFGALDAKVRQELRAWLRKLHDEMPITTIFVTHDQEEAMEIADDIIVVNEGRVEQAGLPAELYDHPANPFVMSFLGPVTSLGGELVRPHDIEVTARPEPGSHPAIVDRLTSLGFQTRLTATLAGGEPVTVQLTRGQARELGVEPGNTVFLRGPAPAGPPAAALSRSGQPMR